MKLTLVSLALIVTALLPALWEYFRGRGPKI
jgi:hypothetical protein